MSDKFIEILKFDNRAETKEDVYIYFFFRTEIGCVISCSSNVRWTLKKRNSLGESCCGFCLTNSRTEYVAIP